MVKPTKQFPLNSVHVGKGTYGDLNVIWIAPNSTRLRIGNYVSIGPKVEFLVGGEHNYHRISTYPFQSFIYKQETKAHINRDIIVEDDVWIGYNSLIMSGVRIGKGSVIGARSIVTKDVPPYSIFVGNRVIKQRFPNKVIEKIQSIDFNSINHLKSDSYESFCQIEVNDDNIDEIIDNFIKNGES